MPIKAELPQPVPEGAIGVIDNGSFVFPNNAIGPSEADRLRFDVPDEIVNNFADDGLVIISSPGLEDLVFSVVTEAEPEITPKKLTLSNKLALSVLPVTMLLGLIASACAPVAPPSAGDSNPDINQPPAISASPRADLTPEPRLPVVGVPTSAAGADRPPPEPASKPLTPETKVISAATVDMVPVTASEANEAFKRTVEVEGKNKYPIPVGLGSTGQIKEFVLANNVRGLVITGLPPGTYTLLAPVDCEAEGIRKEDVKNATTVSVNIYPRNMNMEGDYKNLSFSFPLNAQIVPKRTTPNDRTRDSFTAGQVLAIFTVAPDVPEQKVFEEIFREPGANVAFGFTMKDGKINKEPVNPSDFFLIDSKGRPLVLAPAGKG